ncbi:MAG TPA: FecR family protein [Myxococcales bacterium]|nr:FecR family protein [Myxococcales bacterium]
MAPRGRIRIVSEPAVVLAVLLGSAWLVFRGTLYHPLPGPRAARAAEEKVDEAIVVAVAGDVVRLSPNGGTSALAVGQRLRADDSVRTGRGGHTDLQIGARSRLTIAEGTQLMVREITEKVHRFKLTRGRVAVDYQADGARLLRIESADGEAVAETQGARFGVLSTGTAVAIATETGAVSLSSHGKTVEVRAGAQSIAVEGKPPAGADAIPARLLLKVADAAAAQEREGLCAEVEGTAPSGAEVLVDGAPAAVAEDGRFRVRVPAAPDKTSVVVSIRDARGRETTKTVPCGPGGSVARIKDFAIRWRRKGP